MDSVVGLPPAVTALGIGAKELGMSDTEESVVASLRRMGPGTVLACVAFLLAGAEGRGDPNQHWPFVHRLYSGTSLASRLRELEREGGVDRRLIVPRPLLRVAQIATLHARAGRIVTPVSLARDDLIKIVECSLVLADSYREAAAGGRAGSIDPYDSALELARFYWLGQPPSIVDVDRTHAVLIRHLSPGARSRIDSALKGVHGVTLEELWNALVFEWLRASAGNGTIGPISGPWPAHVLAKDRLELAGRAIRQSVAELIAGVGDDVSTDTPWQFTAFRHRPVTQTTNGFDLVVRPAFVGEKATLAGMFHLIAGAYRQTHGESQYGSYAGEVGLAVDGRCRELIAETAVGSARVLWEGELSATVSTDSRKTCDALWIRDRRWVAMDFVHRQPAMAAQATGGLDALARELRLSVVEKLHQIDETLHRVLIEGRGPEIPHPNEVLPLIINGAGSPVMGIIERVMLESLRAERWRAIGQDARVLDPAVVGLDDLERAAALASTGKANLGSLLVKWKRSKFASASFSFWLWEQRARGALPHVARPESPTKAVVRGIDDGLAES